VALGSDTTVFLANGLKGLWAYSYDGTSFSNAGHINSSGWPMDASGVAVDLDGTVFLANGRDGLRAYSYDGASFSNTAHIDFGNSFNRSVGVAVDSNGTVFLANGHDGLWAYNYEDTSFIATAHINDGGCASGVAVGLDGTVFLANDDDGLRAYSYDGTSFSNTAHINDDGGYWDGAKGVVVGSDGTVFLANKGEGMGAYTYSGFVGIDDNFFSVALNYTLSQNYPNPFNPTTTISYQLPISSSVNIYIYNLLGQKVADLVSKKQPPGNYRIEWNAAGFASGVYFYRLETEKGFVQSRKLVLLK